MNRFEESLLRSMLMLDPDWDIRQHRITPHKHRCDIWIEPHRSRAWWGGLRDDPLEPSPYAWLHVPFGPTRIVLHVNLPLNATDLPRRPWMGVPGLPLTLAMEQELARLCKEAIPLATACRLLKMSPKEALAYPFAADHHRDASATTSRSLVPVAADPVWLRLAQGQVVIDVRALGLKLLLTRVRTEITNATDGSARQKLLGELHRFFMLHERALGHELGQLRVG